jgi:hypothetical protein
MKFIKRTLLVLVAIVALALIIALFIDTDYHVERSVVVNKPSKEVFTYIQHLKNQDDYSVWAKMDPNMKKWYKGTDGTVGFVSYWDSKKEDVGAGEQEIKGIQEGERVDFELRFKRPYETTAAAYMTTEASGENATTVEWGFDGTTPYPFNFFCLFMDMDKMIGSDLEKGLKDMKKELESKPAY